MICAISSGLSPSRSNLKVTIFLLCVSSWHSATLSPTFEICKTFVQVKTVWMTKTIRQDLNELISSDTYTENIELGLPSLLMAGAAAYWSPLVTLQWAALMAASWCRASLIAVTKTWSCIRKATEREMDLLEREQTQCAVLVKPLTITFSSPFYRWRHQSRGSWLHWGWLSNTHRGLKHRRLLLIKHFMSKANINTSPIACALLYFRNINPWSFLYNLNSFHCYFGHLWW